jgi:hypothetical protein
MIADRGVPWAAGDRGSVEPALAGSGSLATVSFTLSEASLALQADGFEAKL